MSCKLEYIETSGFSDTVKNNLTQAHIDIANELYQFRWQNLDKTIGNRIFTYHPDSGQLTVGNNPTSKYYKEAHTKVAIINKRVGGEVGNKVVDLIPVVDNPHLLQVSIDTRRSHGLTLGNRVEEKETDSNLRYLLEDFNKSKITQESDEFVDLVVNPLAGHDGVFNEILDNVNTLLVRYLTGHNGDEAEKGTNLKNLRQLRNLLKSKTEVDNVKALSKYIVMSGWATKHVQSKIDTITEKLQNLPTTLKERQEAMAEVGDFLKQASYYYHLFAPLEDISFEFKRHGINPNPMDNYFRDVLEKELTMFMNDLGLPEGAITEILNKVPERISDPNLIYNDIADVVTSLNPHYPLNESIRAQFESVLTVSENPHQSLHNQIIKNVNSFRVFQHDLKRLHYDVVADMLHPVMEDAFSNDFDAISELVEKFMMRNFPNVDRKKIRGDIGKLLENPENFYKKHINGNLDGFPAFQSEVVESATVKKVSGYKGEKWLLSKDDFKTYLQVGDKDLSFLPFWLGAPIDARDLLARSMAMYFKQIQMYADGAFKQNVGDIQDFLVNNKIGGSGRKLYELPENQQNEIHDTMTFETLVVDNFIPVSQDFEGTSLTVNVLGVERKYKARMGRFYVGEYDTLRFNIDKGAFMEALDGVVEGMMTELNSNNFALRNLENSTDAHLSNLHKSLYYYNEEHKEWGINNDFLKAIEGGWANNFIRGVLQNSFYKSALINRSGKERNLILVENGFFDSSGNFKEINKNFLKKNSSKRRYKENSFSWLTKNNPDSLFSFTYRDVSDEEFGVFLVQFTDGSYDFIQVDVNHKPIIPEGKHIDYIFYNRGVLTSFSDKYKAENSAYSGKWNRVQSNAFIKSYYSELYNLYKRSNEKLGSMGLKFREVQQVPKGSSKLQKAKNIANNITNPQFFADGVVDYFEDLRVEEDSEPLKNVNGDFVDVDGNILPTGANPVYVSRVGMNVDGTQRRSIPIRYRLPLPLEEIDNNLYRSVLMFNMQAEQYSILRDHQSTAQLLGTLINGDTKLKIDPRRVGVVDDKGNPVLQGSLSKVFTKNNPLVTQMMNTLINDTFYNAATPDFNLMGWSSKKIVEQMTGITAYMSLAWNVSTMIPNYGISLVNEKSVSIGNQFWNKKMYDEALREYWKAQMKGEFMRDFTKKGFPSEKSLLTQLSIFFDAIQGEFLSPSGKIEVSGLAEKMMDNALFWTMEMVEHANQLQSMIMLMKGHNIKDGKGGTISVWNAIQEANANRKDGERMTLPEYFTEEQQIKFKLKLQKVNRIVHGNYAKIDKNMLQHTIMGPMLMIFRKWIYDGFKTRFGGADYTWEAQDAVDGYFSSYLKDLNKDFFEIRKEVGWIQAMKQEGWKSFPSALLKTTLAGVDSLAGRSISGSNESIHKFLYREGKEFYELPGNERKLLAMHRASFEIGRMMMLLVVSTGISALKGTLDDDDEAAKSVLTFLEVQSRRIANDIGFFSSFTNIGGGLEMPGLVTMEQFLRIMKDPVVSYRTVDATAGILSHLTDLSHDEEGFHWGVFDQYEKSGNSYEKGDYKIVRKLEKSVIAPYWQIIKLLNPEDQLKYMDMVFKYSK